MPMQKPDLRDISQLTKNEFKRILGPIVGDGFKVVLEMQSVAITLNGSQ